jgi:hypothetical protein
MAVLSKFASKKELLKLEVLDIMLEAQKDLSDP